MDERFRNEYRELGLRIAYYRKKKGYTQEQLAELIDRNPVFIGHVEAPGVKKAMSLDTLFAIAAALEVPVHKFFLFDE
jgi:transcriptional regulator with XRE-family HTH domain